MDLLGAAPTFDEPHVAGLPKRQKRNDQKEELLMLVARGYLGLAAKQRAVESVAFLTYEIHAGDPAVAAAKEVGKKNHEYVKAARAQNKVYKTPQPLNTCQFLAFMDSMKTRDSTGKIQTYVDQFRTDVATAGAQVKYFRILRCFDKTKCKIQVHFTGTTLDAWNNVVVPALKKDKRFKQYSGQAPKNDKERAILKILKEQGEIKDDEDDFFT